MLLLHPCLILPVLGRHILAVDDAQPERPKVPIAASVRTAPQDCYHPRTWI
jgi:hypothetical protein